MTEPDFRSDPMPSAEGRGNAAARFRTAWDAYSRTVNKATKPVVEPAAQKIAGAVVVDAVGFWLTWQLEGGFDGLQRIGMSRASIYRRVKVFRKVFGQHPDEFSFDGVKVDVAAYLQSEKVAIGARIGPQHQSQY